jgi:phosphate transport system substrate-binding protein
MSRLNQTVGTVVQKLSQWVTHHKLISILGVTIPLMISLVNPEIRNYLLKLPTQEYLQGKTKPVAQAQETQKNVKVGGSTSMVKYSKVLALKAKNASKDIIINWERNHTGSEDGVKQLLNGKLDIAAVSRKLTREEKEELVEIPMGVDKIVLVVAKNNPVDNLSKEQVKKIFRCEITNWSQVGGKDQPIRVINRAVNSGTRNAFKETVLTGKEFCNDTDKVTTLMLDRTTIIISMIGRQGIGYGTYTHLNQNKNDVKLLKIDGIAPSEQSYPIKRYLFYVYKNPLNPAAKKFIEYINSHEGREIIENEQKKNDE